MEFQPCYSYHSITDDEEAYISGKNNKIYSWPKNKRSKHILKLWRSAFLRASVVGTLVSKTYANKIDKKFRSKKNICLDEEDVLTTGRVQRQNQTGLEHTRIFGVIPNQRQLAQRFLKKLERKAILRG